MHEKIKHKTKAFTLIELMIVVGIAVVVLLGIGIYMVDIQRGWSKMVSRVHSDVVTDAIIVRKAFDGTVRQATRLYTLVPGGNGIEVNYYDDPVNTTELLPDRYAKFYVSGDQLLVEHGIRDPKTELRTDVLANNVTEWIFSSEGAAAKMFITLDDGKLKIIAACSAVLHN
jgi:prepilin-type N-terminal cleavage/methylation domain-containing protein